MSNATDRLRAIAQAAITGPWDAAQAVSGRVIKQHATGPTVVAECGPYGDEEAEHIATFDPSLVAAMLDVIEAAETDKFSPTPRSAGEWERRSDAVRVALARFREVADE